MVIDEPPKKPLPRGDFSPFPSASRAGVVSATAPEIPPASSGEDVDALMKKLTALRAMSGNISSPPSYASSRPVSAIDTNNPSGIPAAKGSEPNFAT
ncbi:MAG: hypothetical protein AABY11_04260, partial [archaeon]